MKQILFAVCAATFMTCTGMAQNRDQFQVGLKGGMTLSSVYDSQGAEFEANPKIGLTAGAFFKMAIGEYSGLQSELLFSQRRFSATGQTLGAPYKLIHTSNYIDVPVFLTVTPTEFLTVLAGPQYAYLLSEKNVFKRTTLSSDQEREFEDENVQKHILCFVGGCDIRRDNLVFAVRVGWDTSKNSTSESATMPRYKNLWYQLMVGYKLY